MQFVDKPNRYGSDLHEDLILLWDAILNNGWVPPDVVTEDEYRSLMHAPPSALRGFVGFGVSFGGKWFAGYARSSRYKDYCGGSKNSILRKASRMKGVIVGRCSYDAWDDFIPDGSVIYCDPPYYKTTGYNGTPDFDSLKFFHWATNISERCHVLISEHENLEPWFENIADITRTGYGDFGNGAKVVGDNLFYKGPNNWNPSMIPPMPEKTKSQSFSLKGIDFRTI